MYALLCLYFQLFGLMADIGAWYICKEQGGVDHVGTIIGRDMRAG